jgi:hypothetical protein
MISTMRASRVGDGAHGVNLQIHPAQRDGQQFADVAFIVDDQNGLCSHGLLGWQRCCAGY